MESTDAVPTRTKMIAKTEKAHRSKRFDKRPHGYANKMYTRKTSPDPAITWPIATSQGTASFRMTATPALPDGPRGENALMRSAAAPGGWTPPRYPFGEGDRPCRRGAYPSLRSRWYRE